MEPERRPERLAEYEGLVRLAVFQCVGGDLRTKRLILFIVGSNPSLKDKKLNIDARKPFRRWPNPRSVSDSSRFVKDVRTLADAGELAQTLKSIRELWKLAEAAERKLAA